jgi:multidrug efflux pump subunit AcrB
VTIGNIGRTLETMLGSRRVTTYIDAGEEYDVILEGEREVSARRPICRTSMCVHRATAT